MEHTMKDNENQWKMVEIYKKTKRKKKQTMSKNKNIEKNNKNNEERWNMKNQDTHWTTSENNELHRKTMKIHENNGT